MFMAASLFASPPESIADTIADYFKTSPFSGSVYYQDMQTGDVVSFNPDTQYNPASIIKLPIFLIANREIANGSLSPTQNILLANRHRLPGSGLISRSATGTAYSVSELLQLMMIDSDNTATVMMIETLGKPQINKRMTQDLGLKNTQLGTADLLHADGLNWTSAHDMARLLIHLYNGAVISPFWDAHMLGIMRQNHYRWGLPHDLPQTIPVANKTGTLGHVAHDAGIVYYQDRPYVLSIFLSGPGAFIQGRKELAYLAARIHQRHVAGNKVDSAAEKLYSKSARNSNE
jgi:beta-lactamase class A